MHTTGCPIRILVTGGAGFIGSHLVEKLLAEGHIVSVIDLESGKHWPVGSAWYVHDCRESEIGWYALEQLKKCDFIYHLASTVGVPNVLADPSECIDNIVNSTRSVLSLGIPGVYFSTSEVYAKNPKRECLSEDDDCVLSSKSRWSYATAKMCGEWMALQAGWKVVRPFNVVGPRQNMAYGAVLPKFVSQALRGEAITVFGDGSQVRTFIDVRDFMDILLQVCAVREDTWHWKHDFDILNLGGTHIFSIKDLATFVKFWFKSDSEIVYKPYSEAYPEGFEECQSRIPSWKKLESLIGKQTYRRFGETLDSIAADLNGRHIDSHKPDVRGVVS